MPEIDASHKRVEMPLWLVTAVVLLCVLPSLLNVLGTSLVRTGTRVADPRVAQHRVPSAQAAVGPRLRESSFRTILAWSSFSAAMFTVVLTFVHYGATRDVVTPIIGVTLFWAACTQAVQAVAIGELAGISAAGEDLVPFSWTVCRVFNALIPLVGVGFLLAVGERKWGMTSFSIVALASAVFALAAYAVISHYALQGRVPKMVYADAFVTRPWEIVPLAIYLVSAGTVYPVFCRRRRSFFAKCLWLSTIPDAATHGQLLFSTGVMFDNDYLLAHFLRIVASLVPFTGLCLDYVRTHREEQLGRARLQDELTWRLRAEKELAQARRQEVAIASRIQQSLLAGRPPREWPGVTVAAVTIPSQEVDGDFYDFFVQSADRVDVAVGDVMGKGVPAALLGAATKAEILRSMTRLLLRRDGGDLPEPEDIVMQLHTGITPKLIALESAVTLCYARFDMTRHRMTFVDCGHTRTVHFQARAGTCVLLEGQNFPLGFVEDAGYVQSAVGFEDSDVFVLYSDGLTETRNASGDFFGEARLMALVRANHDLAPADLIRRVRKAAADFCGSHRLSDDFTCLVVRIGHTGVEAPLAHAELETSSDPYELGRVRAFVKRFCRSLPGKRLDADTIDRMQLGVNEAATNVMRHAYLGSSEGRILFEADALVDRVVFRLFDTGASFDPAQVVPPPFDGSEEGGFGVYIMRECFDEIDYASDEHGWSRMTLTKQLG